MNPSAQRAPTLLRPLQRPIGPSRRPASIAELAQRARYDLWDERRELKFYLRSAERHRKTGKEYAQGGDLEAAFVEFAKAATLVLEKLPTHKDYLTVLTAEQRHNLGLNGQDILDSLSELKPTLVERYERWVAAHPNAPEADPNYQPQARPESASRQIQSDLLRSQEDARQRGQAEARRKQDQERRAAEELEAWKRQREDSKRYEEGEMGQAKRLGSSAANTGDNSGRREEAAAAQWAPASSQSHREADYTFSRRPADRDTNQFNRPRPEDNRSNAAQADYIRQQDSQRSEEMQRQEQARRQFQQQQQEEMRRREEEITRRRMEERRQEQEGITRRQQEADVAARATRHNISVATSSSSAAPYQVPQSAAVQMPTAMNSHRPPPLLDQYPSNDLVMPLESPSRYEGDSTDSETITDNQTAAWRHARAGKQHRNQSVDNSRTPTRPHLRSPLYPPPITTTSPPPPDGPIRYPQMSQHQKLQGYVPSLHSMFSPIMKPPGAPASLLFEPGANQSQLNLNARSLYAPTLLPQPSAPVTHNQNYPYGMPPQQPYPHQQPPLPHQQAPPPPPLPPLPTQQQQSQYPGYRGPPRAPPLVPPGHTPPTTPPPSAHQRTESARIIKPSTSRADPVPCDLKSVSLPRECLPRFLSIAALNTSRNFETCGLLLGKDKGSKFVVTTLLIPKQHSTSDTCTMDEEELVLQFTEERSLITLGWIHTHPSQSCFMSSVDLHTHSGFQRMLPESFAVVCAPKSNPNFGIFRLTDPPGLQTILDCNVKEAFHPHPDVPIYTDADKGHVQMKDISLEIVDLR